MGVANCREGTWSHYTINVLIVRLIARANKSTSSNVRVVDKLKLAHRLAATHQSDKCAIGAVAIARPAVQHDTQAARLASSRIKFCTKQMVARIRLDDRARVLARLPGVKRTHKVSRQRVSGGVDVHLGKQCVVCGDTEPYAAPVAAFHGRAAQHEGADVGRAEPALETLD